MLPKRIELVEVGPREGFQFEGIGQPDKISTADKIKLINMLSETGLKTIQTTSFVHPKQVPQMADAEDVIAGVRQKAGIRYTAVYLNDVGIRRALATGKVSVTGKVTLTASETFSLRNQKRDAAQDLAMQRKVAALYNENGYAVETGSVMAAFGCNYEGEVAIDRVLGLIEKLHEVVGEVGNELKTVSLADTMGWANPEQIRRTVRAVRERWPSLRIRMHLHDTRGLGIANVYASLLEGVDSFDSAVAGLGGCPFAGHKAAAGNVCTEEIAFLCREIGVETGIDLGKLIECSRFAEEIVGHPVPSKILRAGTERAQPLKAAS
ncbi:MAG: hydroxymethylglutaryl-CoA lyase [Azospirillaceae bacterium]